MIREAYLIEYTNDGEPSTSTTQSATTGTSIRMRSSRV